MMKCVKWTSEKMDGMLADETPLSASSPSLPYHDPRRCHGHRLQHGPGRVHAAAPAQGGAAVHRLLRRGDQVGGEPTRRGGRVRGRGGGGDGGDGFSGCGGDEGGELAFEHVDLCVRGAREGERRHAATRRVPGGVRG